MQTQHSYFMVLSHPNDFSLQNFFVYTSKKLALTLHQQKDNSQTYINKSQLTASINKKNEEVLTTHNNYLKILSASMK